MSCKQTLYDLIFGKGGNSVNEILSNLKKFLNESTDNWQNIAKTIAKDFSQKLLDFIRPIANWIPGQNFGDDIGGVLTDKELPAFRQLMNRIAKHFAEDGEYTRYIDPQEMALYFREDPAFFKEGYVNALMDTTEHLDNGVRIGEHIKPLDEAAAADRRVKWHSFIEELRQGLIDTFGEIRGKQLFDELGLKAAEDAKEINKIIFKWGKMMWNDIFAKAKANGATDEQATALAKIAATSHLNIVGGINSGAYSSAGDATTGLLAWIKKHPLGAVVGSTAFGMAIWYFLDNYTFHIWLGRAAGVLDKLFGDQADEATYRLKSAAFQLKAHPCDKSVQQTYITLLTDLKRLVDYCNTHDVVPEDKIQQYKELYKTVYGVSIGNPNEFERKYIQLDYEFFIDEYVLTVRDAGCVDPIAPPGGWPDVQATGTITFTTTPMGYGADVFIDDMFNPVGKIDSTNGLTIKNLSFASHKVKIKKEGEYTECAGTVVLTESDPNKTFDCGIKCTDWVDTVSISFVPSTDIKPGTVVKFTGAATSVRTITDWLWDFGDPHSPDKDKTSVLQNPEHRYEKAGIFPVTLTATNECVKSKAGDAEVWVGEKPVVEESCTLLVKEPIDSKTGNKCAFSYNAEIYVDNNTIGKKTQFSIPFGTNDKIGGYGGQCGVSHDIKVVLVGYEDAEKRFTIEADELKKWQPEMVKKTVTDTGFIECKTEPTDAEIFIDRVYYGNTAKKIEIASGSQWVIFKKEGYEDCDVPVTVVKGETVIADCTMKAIALHEVEITIPEGAKLFVDGIEIKTTQISRLSTVLRDLRR